MYWHADDADASQRRLKKDKIIKVKSKALKSHL